MMLGDRGGSRSPARSSRCTSAHASRWRYGRDLRGGDLPSRRQAVGARGRQVRRAVADHAHDQRRPAGADARADEHDDAGDGADHVRRRDRDGAARGPRAVEAPARVHPGDGRQHRPHHRPDDPEVPDHAAEDRHREPRAARADHRHAGRARVRARAGGGHAIRRRERRPHGDRVAGRQAPGADVADRDARVQRVERRAVVVRQSPDRRRIARDRRPDRIPRLPDADPRWRDDGDRSCRS